MRWSELFRRNLTLPAVALGLAAMAMPAAASTITVDGNLGDWGVTVADNDGSDFSSLASGIGQTSSFAEDQDDNAGDSGALGPEYGGQNYDAEFMGMAFQSNTLYMAIVGGQRPDNGVKRYAPGDIHLTIDGTDYGIEVGGGVGGGDGSAIDSTVPGGVAGSTYHLDNQGYTNTTTPLLATDSAQQVGTVWTGANWISGVAGPASQMEVAGSSAVQVGTADLVFTRNTQTTEHSVIELALDVSTLIGSGSGSHTFSAYWSPSCGNDIVNTLVTASNETVPEPASSMIWLAGFGAVAGLRYRRKRRRG